MKFVANEFLHKKADTHTLYVEFFHLTGTKKKDIRLNVRVLQTFRKNVYISRFLPWNCRQNFFFFL